MRALMLQEASGPPGLALVDTDEPEVPEGFVAIDVHAAGVGFVDMLISKGEYIKRVTWRMLVATTMLASLLDRRLLAPRSDAGRSSVSP